VTTAALITSAQTLLDKRGGYLSNDRFPPGVFMDNVPNWEFGVLTATRDLARAAQRFLALADAVDRGQGSAGSRSAVQFAQRPLAAAEFESQYGKAIGHVRGYFERLGDNDDSNAQFYARADNLADYLQVVSARLGSLSQKLSAAAGQVRLDTTLAGDPHAQQSTPSPNESRCARRGRRSTTTSTRRAATPGHCASNSKRCASTSPRSSPARTRR
jgi:hypothetical protein